MVKWPVCIRLEGVNGAVAMSETVHGLHDQNERQQAGNGQVMQSAPVSVRVSGESSTRHRR